VIDVPPTGLLLGANDRASSLREDLLYRCNDRPSRCAENSADARADGTTSARTNARTCRATHKGTFFNGLPIEMEPSLDGLQFRKRSRFETHGLPFSNGRNWGAARDWTAQRG
jgi:hypothetical protein